MDDLIQRLPSDHPAFLLALGVVGVIVLVGLVRIVGWVLTGLLNVGFLLAGLVLAAAAGYGVIIGNQVFQMGGLGGLIGVVFIALASKKRQRSG
jgi:hypothetical protein